MTRHEIVEELAKSHVVEDMVRRIYKTPITFDLCDLCQMVYIILLEYDEDKVRELYEKNEIRFFIYRIIRNNVESRNSRYYYIIRKFGEMTDEIDYKTEDQ